jgi:glycosyltransferase involved in cell wall biosynthesis
MPSTISVIIPVYNGERYLAEAINSVFAQTTPAAQIIVVDDGSTDTTRNVADSFGDQIQYVWQPNGGAAAARNHGLSRASGDYVAFLDADDLWLPEKLTIQIAALASTQTDMVFGRVIEFYSPDVSSEIRNRIRCIDTPTLAYLPGTLFTTRDIFTRVGQLSIEWRVGEFIDWYLRASHLGFSTHNMDDVVLKRRLHHTNSGLSNRNVAVDYVRVVKAELDRRRAARNSK